MAKSSNPVGPLPGIRQITMTPSTVDDEIKRQPTKRVQLGGGVRKFVTTDGVRETSRKPTGTRFMAEILDPDHSFKGPAQCLAAIVSRFVGNS